MSIFIQLPKLSKLFWFWDYFVVQKEALYLLVSFNLTPLLLLSDAGREDEELRGQRVGGCWLCRISGSVHWKIQN